MKVFGRYFNYRLKQGALRTLVLTLISLVITITIVDDCCSMRAVPYRTTGIYMLAIIVGAFCTLMPFLELSGFKNRRNLDTLYFFPISRGKMALAHYLSGLVQVFVIYSVCFFSTWGLLALSQSGFALGYMIIYYPLLFLLGTVIYSIMSFLIVQANSVIDGIFFCGLWAFVLFLCIWVVRRYFLRGILMDTPYWSETADFAAWGIVYAPLNNLTVIFQDLIEVNRTGEAAVYSYTAKWAETYMNQVYMFAIWGVIGVAAAVGYFITFVRKGAQSAGETSDSWFGYKLLIPLYGYMLLMMNGDLNILTFIIAALMVVGYVIYRRGFKLKKGDIAFICGGIIPIVLIYLLNQ